MADLAIAFIVAVTLLQITCGCPDSSNPPSSSDRDPGASKAAHKSGDMLDMPPPITLESVKTKLKETGIFDSQDPSLNEREKKELGKLFDSIEIMMTSRTRQPSNAQSMFASLRLLERVVKKQLKEGQVSDSLADKFHWEKLQPERGPTPGMKLKRKGTEERQQPEKPKPKRRNLGPLAAGRKEAKTNRDLAVAVSREDGDLVDEALAKLIRTRLTNLIEGEVIKIWEGKSGAWLPKFNASGLVSEGFFLVTPANVESREWLLNQSFGVIGGHSIKVGTLEKTRVQIWVPGEPGTERFVEMLAIQNADLPELLLRDWRLVSQEKLEKGTLVCFSVPALVEENWGESNYRTLFFLANKVRARLIRGQSSSEGRLKEWGGGNPPQKDPTLEHGRLVSDVAHSEGEGGVSDDGDDSSH